MKKTREHIQVMVTIDEKDKADTLAECLVKEDLAACVQVNGPIESTYKWKGNVERSEEWLCLIKSRKDHYEELEAFIKERHPYENPEIIALSVELGSEEYLDWIDNNLR